jgi:hypothetical protein
MRRQNSELDCNRDSEEGIRRDLRGEEQTADVPWIIDVEAKIRYRRVYRSRIILSGEETFRE